MEMPVNVSNNSFMSLHDTPCLFRLNCATSERALQKFAAADPTWKCMCHFFIRHSFIYHFTFALSVKDANSETNISRWINCVIANKRGHKYDTRHRATDDYSRANERESHALKMFFIAKQLF